MRQTRRYSLNRTSTLPGLSRTGKSRRTGKTSLPFSGRKQGKAQRGMPPVLVRGIAVEAPHQRAKTKSRRRYDVALSVPGAEVRLPALPQIRLGWRLLSGLMASALLGLLYFVWTAPELEISGVEVNGLMRITVEEVEKTLAVEGERIYEIRPGELVEALEQAYPELSSVKVAIDLPAKVSVTGTERQPALAWERNGEKVWVDEEGVVFPVRGDIGPLPVVEGELPTLPTGEDEQEGPLALHPELVVAVLKMAEEVPTENPVVFHPEHGFGWDDWRGWEVYFGPDTSDIDVKLRVYETLADRLESQGINPEFISLEHIHAPYYRMER
jgi:hypothetical protein